MSKADVRSNGRDIIMVTGCPRSGTTAVGTYLASAPRTAYLYEPLNYHSGVKRVSRYFEVPGSGGFSREDLDQLVSGVRRLKLDLKSGLFPEDVGTRLYLKRLIGGRTRVSYWRCKLDPWLRTVIWKDPIAALAAPDIADRHGIPVLVTTREPIAVAASFKRMQWGFKLEEIAARLREAGYTPYRWPDACNDKLDVPAINGAITWALVYDHLLRYQTKALFHFVDIEDIVQRPLETYQALYDTLGLRWTPGSEKAVRQGYRAKQTPSAPLPKRAHVRRRDLSAVNVYGQGSLTDEERSLAEAVTAELWSTLQEQSAWLKG